MPNPNAVIPVARRFSHTVTEYEERDVIVDFKSGETIRCRVPKHWSDNAAATLMSKYAVRAGVPDSEGGVNGREVDAERIFDRLVAGWRAAAIKHGYWSEDDPNLAAFCDEIHAMLEQQRAAPNSPQWFNTGVAVQYGIEAGSDGHYYATVDKHGNADAHECEDSLTHPQISACFIQSVDDKLVGEGGIMDLWSREARLFKYGSGSGANYSKLRGKGEPLSRGGASSGLLSFLRVGDRSAGAIKSGGTTRRSARMVIVDADHPDIEDFVTWKPREDAKIRALHAAGIGDPSSFEDEATDTVSGQNANNSVSVTNAFMRAVENDDTWNLTNRVDGSIAKTIQARDLWQQIAEAAWQCADPGLQFADTINDWHTCESDGRIRGANPCAEYIFLDDTACNLASINLAKFYLPSDPDKRCFDWDGYAHAVRLWTIVLDISVSMAGYPTAEIARRSMLYRTLGLGYAALGELLVLLGLGYGTQRGRDFAAELTSLLTAVAYSTSAELARKLGAFPRFDANREHVLAVVEKHGLAASNRGRGLWLNVMVDVARFGVRNAQVTLLAPTGTIGIAMDCETTGIEPYYSDTTYKTLAGGGSMRLASKRFAEVLERHGYKVEDYTRREYTIENGRVREYVWIEPPAELADVLVCADDLTPEQHVDMMAAVQPFLSGAISKTVNMPSTSTVDDVARMYMYAWRSGLKSIAIYRDGCKPAQPLQGRKPAPDVVETFTSREWAEKVLRNEYTVNKAATSTVVDDLIVKLDINVDTRDAEPPIFDVDVRFIPLQRGERLEPPTTASAIKYRVELSGHTFYLVCGEHEDGSLAEVFVTCSRTGSAIAGWVNAWAKLFSLSLQHGTPLDVLVSASLGESFDPAGYYDSRPVLSPVDCFARIIEARYLTPASEPEVETIEGPEGSVTLVKNESAVVFGQSTPFAASEIARAVERFIGGDCSNCGKPTLVRSGACYVCRSCGTTSGCS